jgi:hypothetical protein
MTEQLIQVWQEMHGLSRIKALLELKYFADLLQKEKASVATETVSAQLEPIITDLEADAYEDPNQICLEI